jgi:hypothetical protein
LLNVTFFSRAAMVDHFSTKKKSTETNIPEIVKSVRSTFAPRMAREKKLLQLFIDPTKRPSVFGTQLRLAVAASKKSPFLDQFLIKSISVHPVNGAAHQHGDRMSFVKKSPKM